MTMDLEQLEQQHAREEAQEAARNLIDEPRPLWVLLPEGGHLPTSTAWLERLYAGGRMAREKKPGVFDHLRSAGPWFVSVDAAPLSVLDGMSQTATLCAGFAEDPVVVAYVEGRFGRSPLVAEDTSLGGSTAADAFAAALRRLCPGLEQVAFTNGGAEANEKAYAICRPHSKFPEARRVLAFEGSFHGRTLLALHATWNASKRAPFEFPGYGAAFAPFPQWDAPMGGEPAAPEGFLACAARGDMEGLRALVGGDALLGAEVASLEAVDAALRGGECFVCAVEPMQSEGGDRYATARFFQALRLLTRHHGIPLIFDEVQTGFGLGGTFFWHERFGLVDAQGRPDRPDAVVMAKRAQVGVVLSRFADPEPTSAHSASLVRGLIHLEMMSSIHAGQVARAVEAEVLPRLRALAEAFPALVLRPRARGFAVAFDMPDAALRDHMISQRFWRGAIVFGAGPATVRYRLANTFTAGEVELLFEAIEGSLAWLRDNPGQKPPAWQDLPVEVDGEEVEPTQRPPIRLRTPGRDEAEEVVRAIMALEAEIFEPARRDPEHRLRLGFDDPEGVVVLAEAQTPEGAWALAAYAIATPLEHMGDQDWITHAPFYGRENTLYSIAISVSPQYQGFGLGKAIKAEQLRVARALRRVDGSPRYHFVSGRNRVGFTDAMQRINRMFGAHEVVTLRNQYGDPNGAALYYRIPLGPLRPEQPSSSPWAMDFDLAGTLGAPFEEPPDSLVALSEAGGLAGPTINKITICNYVTPATVRAIERICAQAPHLPHLYLTSGRDETADKAIRTLRYHRAEAAVVIGVEGGYLGHTSSGARSVSDPATHRQGAPIFDWPLIPHPARVGAEASLAALRATVAAAGGPARVVGLFIEPVQERTGWTAPAAFWEGLAALRAELDLPLVFVETASSYHRSGLGAFASAALPLEPDVMIWWGGGQQGFVHLKARYFIDSPLMMVSTWDGDELSLIRVAHQLRASRQLDLTEAIQAMDRAVAVAAAAGIEAHGLGLYRVLHAGLRAEAISGALAARGLHTRLLPGDRIVTAPALDVALEGAQTLEAALREIL